VVVEELGSDDEADLYEGPILDDDDDKEEDEDLTDNTPEARIEMYREIAEQKREKEERESVNHPKERDYEKEQAEAKESIRKKEGDSKEEEEVAVRQKNEGGWNFYWDEESIKGSIRLEVCLSRHLDSSLIDVDMHPTYVSIIIKSKLLRLHLPAEVRSGETKCQRSKTTGSLVLTMPKLNSRETTIFSRVDEQKKINDKTASKTRGSAVKQNTTIRKPKQLSMQDQMLADAAAAAKAKADGTTLEPTGPTMSVDIRNIVPQKVKRGDPDTLKLDVDLNASENVVNKANSLIHEID
jgi:protein TilB